MIPENTTAVATVATAVAAALAAAGKTTGYQNTYTPDMQEFTNNSYSVPLLVPAALPAVGENTGYPPYTPNIQDYIDKNATQLEWGDSPIHSYNNATLPESTPLGTPTSTAVSVVRPDSSRQVAVLSSNVSPSGVYPSKAVALAKDGLNIMPLTVHASANTDPRDFDSKLHISPQETLRYDKTLPRRLSNDNAVELPRPKNSSDPHPLPGFSGLLAAAAAAAVSTLAGRREGGREGRRETKKRLYKEREASSAEEYEALLHANEEAVLLASRREGGMEGNREMKKRLAEEAEERLFKERLADEYEAYSPEEYGAVLHANEEVVLLADEEEKKPRALQENIDSLFGRENKTRERIASLHAEHASSLAEHASSLTEHASSLARGVEIKKRLASLDKEDLHGGEIDKLTQLHSQISGLQLRVNRML